jgi:disulfide bond formation protein DsbB
MAENEKKEPEEKPIEEEPLEEITPEPTSSTRLPGAIIAVVSIIFLVAQLVCVTGLCNSDAWKLFGQNLQFWAIAAPVTIGWVGFCLIFLWIGIELFKS